MLSADIADPENLLDSPADRAILDARFATIEDLHLQPFSGMRALIAQAMGFRFPYIGLEAVEQFRATGLYPGALRDVAIYFWIRSRGKLELRRAYWRLNESIEEAITWAEEQGIADPSASKFREAFTLMQQLQNDAAEAQPRGDEESSGDPAKKNEQSPPLAH